MQGRKTAIRLEIHDDTCATLAGWLRRQKTPGWLGQPGTGHVVAGRRAQLCSHRQTG